MQRSLFVRTVTHIVCIAALGLLVYANSIDAPFYFDDTRNIVDNPIVKDFSYFADTGRAAGFEQYNALRSRYIGFLTFFLNYKVNGLDVRGYHLVNIFIHIINALLVYALVLLTFLTPALRDSKLFDRRLWVALLSAVLFTVHPVNTQAVTYIVQRLASLVALFYLGSMVCYIKARLLEGGRKWLYYVGALVLAVFAMKTKENAFTLPLAIALYEFMFFRGEPLKKRVALLLPFLFIMLIIPLALIDIGKPAMEVMSDVSEKTAVQDLPRDAYLLTEMRVMTTYLRLLALPMNQNLDYDYPVFTSIAQGPVLWSFALLAALILLSIYLYRKEEPAAKLASFGIVFFFLALSVESTLVPLFPIYEHRMYLPGVGLFVSAAAGGGLFMKELQFSVMRKLAYILVAVFLLCFCIAAMVRNNVWSDEINFWKDVVRKAPDSARGHNNLGLAYHDEKHLIDEAISQYKRALSLDPGLPHAHHNLAVAYLERKDYKSAVEQLKIAISIRPRSPLAYNALGMAYAEQGQFSEANRYLMRAIEMDPYLYEAYNNLGSVCTKSGEYEKAMAYYRKALLIKPDFAIVRNNLGILLFKKGQTESAVEEYKKAILLKPDYAEAYNNLGQTLGFEGKYIEALPYFKKAISLAPDYAEAHINLGKGYVLLGQIRDAQKEIKRIEELGADSTEVRRLLHNKLSK